jgi:hypothetical protein
MKLYSMLGIKAAGATLLLALVAGVSTASAQPAAAKPAQAAAQVVNVMLHTGSIGFAPNRVLPGRTTLVVRNGRSASTTFIIARHTGGLNTLPHYNAMTYVPREEIVGRISRLTPGTQKRLTLMLATGNYLVLTSKGTLGGDSPIFVETAARIAVS